MDETTADFLACQPGEWWKSGFKPWPVFITPYVFLNVSWTRTVNNALGVEGSWTVSTVASELSTLWLLPLTSHRQQAQAKN